MSIFVYCSNGHKLKVDDRYAGKTGVCPRCHESVQVPAPRREISDSSVLDVLGDYEPEPLSRKPRGDLHAPQQVTRSCPTCGKEVAVSYRACPSCHSYLPLPAASA